MKHRAQIVNKLRDEFKTNVPLIVHWNEKLMQDLTNKQHVDRLPIIVSGLGANQLLKIAQILMELGNLKQMLSFWHYKNGGWQKKLLACLLTGLLLTLEERMMLAFSEKQNLKQIFYILHAVITYQNW